MSATPERLDALGAGLWFAPPNVETAVETTPHTAWSTMHRYLAGEALDVPPAAPGQRCTRHECPDTDVKACQTPPCNVTPPC